jgi:ABC-type transporter Mla MlaB component
MHASILNNTLHLSGTLNEDTDFHVLQKKISTLPSRSFSVNLKQVERANSCGIIAWFKMVRELQLRVSYVEAPIWLIEQLNMNPFFLKGCSVKSFYAPFYDTASNEHEILLLELGKDVPYLNDFSNFEIDPAELGRPELEADFDSEEYFQFISANCEEIEARES